MTMLNNLPLNLSALLDQILDDWASPRVRRLIHALILLLVLVVTVFLAADGNWREALVSLAVALYAAANKANTPATALTPAGADTEPDDGLSYSEAGGANYDADTVLHADDFDFEPEHLYQPGEKQYERFSEGKIPLEDIPAVSRNDGLGGDPDPENPYFNKDGSRRY